MAKESLNFFESERKNIVITQEHILINTDFDYVSEVEALYAWLDTIKKWESLLEYSKTRKRNEVDTRVANEIFMVTHKKWESSLDSVQIFDTLTKYYDFDETDFFNRLAQKNRAILIKDLSIRIGDLSLNRDIKIDEDKIQKSFAILFNK